MAKAKVETNADKATDMARKIWLAGIGAYGRAFNEAQERLEKVGKESTKFFEELVAKGEELEDDAKEALSNVDVLHDIKEQADKFRSDAEQATEDGISLIEDRISKVRDSLGFGANWLTLGQRVEELTTKVDDLAADLAEIKKAVVKKPARKTAAKKTATKKTAAKRTPKKKTARKKAA